VYAGYYPADSAAAVEHLEELRRAGVEYLLLPSTAFWWLDHYSEFADFLTTRHTAIFADCDCRLYKLMGPDADRNVCKVAEASAAA
jgi:hypothetical protein